jgi:hypothetical protein
MLALLAALALATPPAGENLRTLPSDTFGDVHVRALVERARTTRGVAAEGLLSYDGRMWERVYVGLDAAGFRRERGLFHQERTARIRWEREGERIVRWDGARRDIPIAGLSSDGREAMARGLARQLLRDGVPPPLRYEPGSDRILFQDDGWALHPLADTAGLHYRFHSGDTLRITLPEEGRRITLAEIRVEPRRSEFRLLAASLWFETETAALVRAVYRPARPFDMELDEPEDAADIPRIFRPIRAEIRIISVDHSLHDFQWWIPRRFVFEGEAQVGRLARFPVKLEWTVTEIDVNRDLPESLAPGPLPPGWSRREVRQSPGSGDGRLTVVTIVPPAEELARGEGLTSPDLRDPVSFRPEELRILEDRVRELLPRPPGLALQTAWGLQEGLTRYNRVEGLASGVAASVPLSGERTIRGEVRIGMLEPVPTGELRFASGIAQRGFEAAAYRRLESSSEWENPHGLNASLSSLVFGGGPTPFYRTMGAEAAWTRRTSTRAVTLRLFGERHDSAKKNTDFHLWRVFSDSDLHENPVADEGWFGGAALVHRWQQGVDPSVPRVFSRLALEGAGGETAYGRARGSVGVTVPLAPGWDAAAEVGAGGSLGDLPHQRRFFPGGSAGYRGARVGELDGSSFWLGRTEIGRGLPAARVVAFADALRVMEDGDRIAGSSEVAVGLGASVLDGLLRVDVARQVTGGGHWRFLFYLDALF